MIPLLQYGFSTLKCVYMGNMPASSLLKGTQVMPFSNLSLPICNKYMILTYILRQLFSLIHWYFQSPLWSSDEDWQQSQYYIHISNYLWFSMVHHYIIKTYRLYALWEMDSNEFCSTVPYAMESQPRLRNLVNSVMNDNTETLFCKLTLVRWISRFTVLLFT